METGMISTAITATPQTKTASNTLDKDGFLKLLVEQLKNQDPTAPQDSDKMVEQLTSFSSLEESQKTNALLLGLQTQTAGLFQAQTAGLVGRNVKVDGSGFNLKSGSATMNIELAAAADVTLTVKDANGNVIATLPQGHLARGTTALTWDGLDSSGNPVPDGAYKVEVTASGDDGKAVPFRTSLTMKVDAVTFRDGGIYLASGGNIFSLADVLEITA
ncbi:MAG: FlgD immunoglobulin-like domain containing protein [Geothrix sp.]|nr:FlgD immunoglobulin-like domain containing protein [Geothrix sp.]